MCLLVAQTMASELLLGGGVHEDYFSRLTFSLKGVPFCLSPFTRLLQYLYTSEGLLFSITFPLLAAAAVVVFFFCQSSVRYQNCVAFLSAAPSRRDLSVYISFLRFVADFGTSSGADLQVLFAVFVDSINNISWFKRKVGPMVYITELGTLESATAP